MKSGSIRSSFYQPLRQRIAGSHQDVVPLLTGQADLRGLGAVCNALGIHAADDGLHVGGMAQDPSNGDSSVGNAVFFRDLVDLGIQLRLLLAAEEYALEHAVLEGRPRLDGDVIQAAVIQHAAVAVDGEIAVDVDVHAGRHHARMGNGELQLIGHDGLLDVLLQQLDLRRDLSRCISPTNLYL